MIFLDIETKSGVFEHGDDAMKKMEISYAGCIDYDTKELTSIWDKPEDYKKLGDLLFSTDMVAGYNLISFDMPIIANYLGEKVMDIPMLDLMVAFQKAAGFRIKLDNLCKATLGKGKIGSGLDAVKYYAAGELDKLKKYCDEDVRLTMELYDWGKEHGKVKYLDRSGFVVEMPIDWEDGMINVKEDFEEKGNRPSSQPSLF